MATKSPESAVASRDRVSIPKSAISGDRVTSIPASRSDQRLRAVHGPCSCSVLGSDRFRANPHAYEFYATLLADIDGIVYQTAKAAMERSVELIPELLSLRNVTLSADQIKKMSNDLLNSAMHSATISHTTALRYGLPIEYMEPRSESWDKLWRLHAHYVYNLGAHPIVNQVEGRRVSFRFGNRPI